MGSAEQVDSSEQGSRAAEVAVYVLAALLMVVAVYKARHFYEDDAFITLRYVQRWLDGSGLTWTDGERVQGFTDPLWLLQLALVGSLGADLPNASRVLGVVYLVGIFTLFQRARALPSSVLVLATLPGLSVWAMGGLETVSFAFWLILAALLAGRIVAADEPASQRAGALAGAALAAATLTRPEGLGVAMIAASWVATSRRWGALRALVGAFAAPIAAWELFTATYYGDWVANPVRAKISGYPLLQSVEDGLTYLAVTASSWAWAVAASVLALAFARKISALWILAMACPMLAGLLVGGGDHMVGVRLLLPGVLLVVFAAGVHGRSRTRSARFVPFLLAGAAVLQAPVALEGDRPPDLAAVIGGMAGRFLEASLPRGSLAAISAAGATAFFAPSLRFVDTLGLTDRHIARRAAPAGVTNWQSMAGHRKGDGAYVLSRAPDVVILGAAAGFLGLDPREWFLTDYELLDSPEFRREYRPFAFRLAEGDSQGLPNLYLTAYLRRGSPKADALAASGTGIRLRGPWITESRHTAASATGAGFQPQ